MHVWVLERVAVVNGIEHTTFLGANISRKKTQNHMNDWVYRHFEFFPDEKPDFYYIYKYDMLCMGRIPTDIGKIKLQGDEIYHEPQPPVFCGTCDSQLEAGDGDYEHKETRGDEKQGVHKACCDKDENGCDCPRHLLPFDKARNLIEGTHKKLKELELKNEDLMDTLRDIGDGPGYPLDNCPKCDAAKIAINKVNKYDNTSDDLKPEPDKNEPNVEFTPKDLKYEDKIEDTIFDADRSNLFENEVVHTNPEPTTPRPTPPGLVKPDPLIFSTRSRQDKKIVWLFRHTFSCLNRDTVETTEWGRRSWGDFFNEDKSIVFHNTETQGFYEWLSDEEVQKVHQKIKDEQK